MGQKGGLLAIYGPMIYTAPYVMLFMRTDTLRGQVGGGWALEIDMFLALVKWHREDWRVPCVPFVDQKSRDFKGPTHSHLPK